MLSKMLAFLKRDYKNEVSYRLSFLMNFFGIFFSIMIFFFISRVFGKAVSPYLAPYGGNYFSFVLIGIAFSGFLGFGLGTFASTISSAQHLGTLEAMLVTPTRLSEIVFFSSIWGFLFTCFNVLVYLTFGAVVFGLNLSSANLPAALLILLLTVSTFSGMGIISASFIMVFKRGDPVKWLYGSVSSLVGGTLFPVSVLPVWLQKLAYLFPIFYALRAMRYAVLRGHSLTMLLPDIVALMVFSAVIVPASIAAFRHAVRRAKVEGTLGTY